MLDPEQGAYFGLNPVGSRIWELIERPSAVAEVCRVLTAEFEVDDRTCQSEVLGFLGRLDASRLIEVRP